MTGYLLSYCDPDHVALIRTVCRKRAGRNGEVVNDET